MATEYVAAAAARNRPAIQATGGGISENSGKIELGALVVSDTIDVCKLPAGEVPVDLIGNIDALDDVADLVLDIGLYDADGDADDSDCFNDGVTYGQTAGVFRMTNIAAREIAPCPRERLVRVTVMTAPATGAAGGLGITLLSRAQGLDDTPVA